MPFSRATVSGRHQMTPDKGTTNWYHPNDRRSLRRKIRAAITLASITPRPSLCVYRARVFAHTRTGYVPRYVSLSLSSPVVPPRVYLRKSRREISRCHLRRSDGINFVTGVPTLCRRKYTELWFFFFFLLYRVENLRYSRLLDPNTQISVNKSIRKSRDLKRLL